MRIENSLKIDAPIAAVWDLTVDVESYPKYTSTMTSVELIDGRSIQVGNRALIKQPGQPAKVWTIITLEPQKQFAWSTRVMGTRMTGWHILSPSGTGTTNTLAVDVKGVLAPVIGPLLKRSIRKAIETENLGFQAAATGT